MVPELETEEEEESSSSLSQEMQFLELGLEEAFFLTSELKCICIYQQQTSEVDYKPLSFSLTDAISAAAVLVYQV